MMKIGYDWSTGQAVPAPKKKRRFDFSWEGYDNRHEHYKQGIAYPWLIKL
ncbi:MAG TPA: hypothetical protein VI728_00675 [Syntrophales bacterium]|nr:hypothetical protein [Syntrophales bacterium]